MSLTPLLKTNLFDSSGQNTMSITQSLPPGTSLDATSVAAGKVEAILKDTPGVDIYQYTAGSTGSLFGAGGGTNASSSQATFAITTDPNADKNAIIEDVRAQVAKLSNAGTITVTGEDSTMGGGMSQLEVRVSAADPAVLKEANDMVLAQMKTVEGLADVTSNLSEGRPSATIVVDQAKAAAAGVTPSTLSQYTTLVLNGYPLGTVPTTAGTLPAQLMVGEITVPPLPGAVSQVLTRLPVAGTSGMVPLGDIAKVVEVKAPVQVTHVDGARTASVTAASVDNNIGAASSAVTKALDGLTLPQGATWELGGATQATNDVFRSLGIAMLVAILLVYIIMVATFRSLLNPLILLVSIPFAAVGAVLALVDHGDEPRHAEPRRSAHADRHRRDQRHRAPRPRGAVPAQGHGRAHGGHRRRAAAPAPHPHDGRRHDPRARPDGARLRRQGGGFLSTPLAVVVIGGLFTSTFLTLILVPVLYLAFDRLRPAGAYAPDDEDYTSLAPEPAPAD